MGKASYERLPGKAQKQSCIQWNIPQPLETTNTQHLLRRGWNWRVLCCEVSQSEKDKKCMFSFIWGI